MAENDISESCCTSAGSYRVEAIVTVDERGQMVLPKEVRDKAAIRPGDKLAVVTWEKDRSVCCISLIRAEELAGMVKNLLGPMLREISTK
ncbi:MAG: HgcAB-associated protein [Chloroflexota bacterium]